ncbi:M15 family metallopeptidase [Lacinutrix sp. MedPE-SW]|uniref:M15 family metallopeptidase n=1 Tax=Lacinutrix sp. MedPE-SW TaxID=1860087 RepID=UPI00091FAD28|nr:M15 family metallopeptidase [Lacinutrix sp. MedPE-SW]OIQ18144.1 MAG: D-alanyl-D-alanine carboxypeptidase [Lacinutrix sp. MedPE-SW]
MNRRHFLKKTSLTTAAIVTLPKTFFNQDDSITINQLIGKGQPVLLGNGYKLLEEAHIAFKKLQKEALKSNIKIAAVSSYRSYSHQKRIWERKYKSNNTKGLTPKANIKKIIEYSTIPGTSRHHWGTDIDIYQTNVKQPNSILQPKNYHDNGSYCKLKEWMDTNASYFGFHLVYTDISNRKGFKYEPWHYSYKPLSQNFLKAYKKIDISKILQNDNLLGSNYFTKEFINQYITQNILDINPELL